MAIMPDPPEDPADFGPWVSRLMKKEAISQVSIVRDRALAGEIRTTRLIGILGGLPPYEHERAAILAALTARFERMT